MEGLQTNNRIAERDFPTFDRLSKVGKNCNCLFKAKTIRNTMNLINSDNFKVEKYCEKDYAYANRETSCYDQQKMKLKLRLTKKN